MECGTGQRTLYISRDNQGLCEPFKDKDLNKDCNAEKCIKEIHQRKEFVNWRKMAPKYDWRKQGGGRWSTVTGDPGKTPSQKMSMLSKVKISWFLEIIITKVSLTDANHGNWIEEGAFKMREYIQKRDIANYIFELIFCDVEWYMTGFIRLAKQ